MRSIVLVVVLVLVSGCAEMGGPRVVRYTDSNFYVRHVPIVDSDESIDELAAELCGEVGKQPQLWDTLNLYPTDIRYAAYRCVASPSEAAPASGSGGTSAM